MNDFFAFKGNINCCFQFYSLINITFHRSQIKIFHHTFTGIRLEQYIIKDNLVNYYYFLSFIYLFIYYIFLNLCEMIK